MTQKIHKSVSFHDLERQGVEIKLLEKLKTVDAVVESYYIITEVKYKGSVIKKERLDKALHILGIKTTAGYSVMPITTHRTLAGELYTGHRIVGLERGDKDWLRNPMCSDEAKVSASKMKDMLSTLRSMGG